MKIFQQFLFIILSLIIAAVLYAGDLAKVTPKVSFTEAASGKPDTLPNLNDESFAPFEAKRLQKAQVVFRNDDLLRDMGITIPGDEEILNELAYMVPQASDNKDLFVEGKGKIFYADKYGGTRMGSAYGSGRAAITGRFQIKGLGRTPLASPLEPVAKPKGKEWLSPRIVSDYVGDLIHTWNHNHGKSSVREAIQEALWGEILNQELPNGANRIAAIISTGTYISWNGIKEPAFLIVRVNPLRPAHYMLNKAKLIEEPQEEFERVANLTSQNLLENLPKAPSETSKMDQKTLLTLRLKEFTKRVGALYGTLYSRSIYQGSTSPSNIEINGQALDLTPMSAIDGFTQIQHNEEFGNGDTRAFKKFILQDFFDDLRTVLPQDFYDSVPNDKILNQVFNESYNNTLIREFLLLAGTPLEFVDELSQTKVGKELAQKLIQMAHTGNEKMIDGSKKIPIDTGRFDMEAVCKLLANNSELGQKRLSEELALTLRSPPLEKELAKLFNNYMFTLKGKASNVGISPENLKKYMVEATTVRNRRLTELFRGPKLMREMYGKLVESYLGGDYTPIQDFIDSNKNTGIRNVTDAPLFGVVTKRQHFRESGATLDNYFNAKSGASELKVELLANNGKVNFFGQEIPVASIANLEISFKNDKKPRIFKPTILSDRITGVISEVPASSLLQQIELKTTTGEVLTFNPEESLKKKSFPSRVILNCAKLFTAPK